MPTARSKPVKVSVSMLVRELSRLAVCRGCPLTLFEADDVSDRLAREINAMPPWEVREAYNQHLSCWERTEEA